MVLKCRAAHKLTAEWSVIRAVYSRRGDHGYTCSESQRACSAEARLINLQSCRGPLSSTPRVLKAPFCLIDFKSCGINLGSPRTEQVLRVCLLIYVQSEIGMERCTTWGERQDNCKMVFRVIEKMDRILYPPVMHQGELNISNVNV